MKKENMNETTHKLSNLLTNINLSAELLIKGLYGPLQEKQKKCAKNILSDGRRMKALIKEIGKNLD